jgi:hypothetical protein
MVEDHNARRVREAAREKEWTPENLASKLDDWDALAPRTVERIKAERERWAPLLRSLVAGPPASALQLMNAGFLLLELGDSGGTSALLRALEQSEINIWMRILVGLSIGGPTLPPLDTRTIAPVILSCLEDPRHPVAQPAMQVAARFHIEEAESRLRELVDDPSEEIRAEAICALLGIRPDASVLEAAERLVLHADVAEHERRVAGAIRRATFPDDGAKAMAGAILAGYADLHAGTQDNTRANAIYFSALTYLADASHPEAVGLLEKTIGSPGLPWLRSGCLKKLAQLKGPESLPAIVKSLSDPALLEGAAGALETLAEAGALPALPLEIAGIIEGWTNREALARMARVFMDLDVPEARAILPRIADRMSPQDAMGAHWYMVGLTPTKAARNLVAHGVLSTELPRERIEAIEALWREKRRPFVALQDLLHEAKILTLFDREYWRTPIDYDDVIRVLSRGSAGVFEPEAIAQEYREAGSASGGYSVEFLYGGKLHAFMARDGGDWIDVESLLAGLNGALAASGRKERFQELLSSDQIAIIVFAEEAGLRRAASELYLPLAS